MKELLNETMTRAAHELDMARLERANKRVCIALLLMTLLFVGTNAWWIYRESQFTDEVTTTTTIDATQDGDGNNTVVGGDYEPESENNANN